MIVRLTSSIAALFLVLGGLVMLPLPIPLGIPMIVGGTGFAIIASPRVTRWVRSYRSKSPRLEDAIARARPRLPRPLLKPIEKSDPDRRL